MISRRKQDSAPGSLLHAPEVRQEQASTRNTTAGLQGRPEERGSAERRLLSPHQKITDKEMDVILAGCTYSSQVPVPVNIREIDRSTFNQTSSSLKRWVVN